MLKLGITGECSETVTEQLTAKNVGSGMLDVLATPSLIALIEKTACESVQPLLDEGTGTVGTAVNVKHVSATPVGEKIRAESELTEIDGRRLVFNVRAYDEVGLICEGTHERFVIDNEKFMSKMNQKHGK